MNYRVASRIFYVLGIIFMFIPMLTGMYDIKFIFIPGGFLLSVAGFLLMGQKKKKRKINENILDDGEF